MRGVKYKDVIILVAAALIIANGLLLSAIAKEKYYDNDTNKEYKDYNKQIISSDISETTKNLNGFGTDIPDINGGVKIEHVELRFAGGILHLRGYPPYTNSNYIRGFPSDSFPLFIHWYFDGVSTPRGAEPPYAALYRLSTDFPPVFKVTGPQKGWALLTLPDVYDPYALHFTGRAFGSILCWNYSSIEPLAAPVFPGRDNPQDVSISPVFEWSLVDENGNIMPDYWNEENLATWNLHITQIDLFEMPLGKHRTFDMWDVRDRHLLKYDTTYSWQVWAKTDTPKGIESEKPAPWSFKTMKDPNQPIHTYSHCPYDGAQNFPISNSLSWKGGDPDKYDQVKYILYLNISQNLDENSLVFHETDKWYDWNYPHLIEYNEYNLEPGQDYWWRVDTVDWGEQLTKGEPLHFRTASS